MNSSYCDFMVLNTNVFNPLFAQTEVCVWVDPSAHLKGSLGGMKSESQDRTDTFAS